MTVMTVMIMMMMMVMMMIVMMMIITFVRMPSRSFSIVSLMVSLVLP